MAKKLCVLSSRRCLLILFFLISLNLDSHELVNYLPDSAKVSVVRKELPNKETQYTYKIMGIIRDHEPANQIRENMLFVAFSRTFYDHKKYFISPLSKLEKQIYVNFTMSPLLFLKTKELTETFQIIKDLEHPYWAKGEVSFTFTQEGLRESQQIFQQMINNKKKLFTLPFFAILIVSLIAAKIKSKSLKME